MSDLIDRQAVIDAIEREAYRHTYIEQIIDIIGKLPSAQPEKRTEERTETHACDLVSRHAAIEALYHVDEYNGRSIEAIRNLPCAQPEIIRCSQCKYAEVADKEDAQDGYACQFHRGSIWFSGSYCSWAERRTDG